MENSTLRLSKKWSKVAVIGRLIVKKYLKGAGNISVISVLFSLGMSSPSSEVRYFYSQYKSLTNKFDLLSLVKAVVSNNILINDYSI